MTGPQASEPSRRERRVAAIIAAAAAIGIAVFGINKGTWAAGGSDSSCYALMADAFAQGAIQPSTPLALEAPWPDAARTFAPAGFIPSPVRRDAASPICAPGFSLLLTPFRLMAGRDGIFLLTPMAGALLIWLTFIFGTQIGGALAGAAAAVVVATTPVVLFQVTQPMNDIMVAALWMAVLVAASAPDPSRAWLSGALTGLAILVRPNLAPAGAVVAIWLTVRWMREASGLAALRRQLTAFALAGAPFVAVMLWLNVSLYGHSLESGYGSTRDLFSAHHILPNLRQYGGALLETQLGLPVLGVTALVGSRPLARPVIWLALLVSAVVIAIYLPYQRFTEWWYLRFLLPALVPLTALAVAAAARVILGRRPGAVRLMVGAVLIACIAWFGVATSRNRQVFELQRLEGRFRRSGAVARELLPARAAFITVWHSGTLRFHANRLSLLWDSIDPESLDSTMGWLSTRGFDPYVVVERWEEPLFRQRFTAHSKFGGLDWPPRFDIDRQVRVFKVSDRELYMTGGNVPTEFILR